MIRFRQKGDFKKTTSFLERCKELFRNGMLDKYGRKGVEALSNATPVDTGLTADSWYYEIRHEKDRTRLIFKNRNVNEGVMIAILLQYGHTTGFGGWVEGIDYINPAIRPIFKKLLNDMWEEVRKK